MTTAFVLSGGASHGAIQVGMLEALYERGIEPDVIVGTSAGAVNGAFIASRPQAVETARELGKVWTGLRRGQVFPVDPVTGALGFLGARNHLVPGSGLRQLVQAHMTVERLEQTALPLHVIATDVLRGEEVRLSKGPLIDAVMASAAIPGVLPAIDWDGRQLLDGGVTNNAPISHALDLGASEIYVLSAGTPCELDEPPRGALAMLVHATTLLVGRRLAQDVGSLPDDAEVAVLPPPCALNVQPTDFSKAELLIDQALEDARGFLDRRERPRRRVPLPATGAGGSGCWRPRHTPVGRPRDAPAAIGTGRSALARPGGAGLRR